MYPRDDVFLRGGRSEKDVTTSKINEPIWNDYYEAEPFRSSRLLLGMYGGLPFTWEKPHMPSRHPAKSTFLIAIILVSVLGLSECHLIVSCYQKMLGDHVHLTDVILLLEVILYSFFYFFYFAMWLDVPATEKSITTWLQLWKMYHRMTGRSLTLRRRSLEKKVNIASVIFPALCVIAADWANPQIKVELAYYPVLIFSSTSGLLYAILWIIHFESLQKVARSINMYLKMDLEKDSLTVRKLQEYREIWLAMRSLTGYASSLYTPIMIYVTCVVLIVFLFYEMIVAFQIGNVSSAIIHANLWITSSYSIQYMANASSNAVLEIKKFYTNILTRESLHSMIPNKQREIIGLYLVGRSGSPVPSYGGFLTLNRAQALSVFSAISSYLVLLMQFSQKANQEEGNI